MRKQLFVLAALAGAATITASTQAAFISVVTTDGTVDGTWQTAVISVSGLTARLEAVSGAPGALMLFQTGNGSALYNHDTVIFSGFTFHEGESAFAASDLTAFGAPLAQFDSGVLLPFGDPDTTLSPGFLGEITSFSFSSSLSDSSTNSAIFDIDLDTPELGPSIEVFRVTWKRTTSLDVAFQVSQTSAAFDEYLQITLPAIPAPGAFALLGLAGLVGLPRRRRA